MGLWDSIGSALSSAAGWVGDNSNLIKPLVQTGAGLYGMSQQQQGQSAYLDYLRDVEDQSAASQNAAFVASGGGGGGGSVDTSAQQELFLPYHQAGLDLLPARTQSTGEALAIISELLGTYDKEKVSEITDRPKAPEEYVVKLPAHLRRLARGE